MCVSNKIAIAVSFKDFALKFHCAFFDKKQMIPYMNPCNR